MAEREALRRAIQATDGARGDRIHLVTDFAWLLVDRQSGGTLTPAVDHIRGLLPEVEGFPIPGGFPDPGAGD